MARVIFFGTPDFSIPCLQSLHDHPEIDVVGVVTQPDRPAGRGQAIRQSPVKQRAVTLGLPVCQPESLRGEEPLERLGNWSPDVMVVVAYGHILREPVLELPSWGCINVHASLLPRWRGAAPIQYAIRAGDTQTGVTIMKMDKGLDTGPILSMHKIPIASNETAATLHDKLADLGARMLPSILLEYLSGQIVPRPQPDEGATYAPTLKKENGQIDWTQAAAEIDCQVRAYDPWPGTFTYLEKQRIKIISGRPEPEQNKKASPGTLFESDGFLLVQTGSGCYRLHEIQPAGGKRMTSQAFLAGHANIISAAFESN